MLLGDYGSDSESENEAGPSSVTSAPQSASTAKPAPAASTTPVTAANSARPKKRGGPVRITLDLPKTSRSGRDIHDEETAGISGDGSRSDDEFGDGPDAKKPKTGSGGIKGGKGSSMLLGMLPPPKRKLPVAGGSKPSLAVNKSMATTSVSRQPEGGIGAVSADSESAGSGMMRPPALSRGKGKAPVTSKDDEDDGLDLFGLGSAKTTTSTPSMAASSSIKPPTITSAPSVAEYVPPPPTASDPYPGYYQLPSGSWAAYDPAYYASFFPSGALGASEDDLIARPKGQRGEDGRLGHHWDAFEGREGDVVDVYAGSGLEEARKEEERRKAMVKPKLAGDDFEYKAVGQIKGLASERHQLSSLLNTAYTQREALEERIAQNRRNARAGKAKYGF